MRLVPGRKLEQELEEKKKSVNFLVRYLLAKNQIKLNWVQPTWSIRWNWRVSWCWHRQTVGGRVAVTSSVANWWNGYLVERKSSVNSFETLIDLRWAHRSWTFDTNRMLGRRSMLSWPDRRRRFSCMRLRLACRRLEPVLAVHRQVQLW